MVVVLHRGGLANDYGIGYYIRNVIYIDLKKSQIF